MNYLSCVRKYQEKYSRLRKGYEGGINRCSHPEVLCRKGTPRNPTKPTGKHPCQSLPTNRVTA